MLLLHVIKEEAAYVKAMLGKHYRVCSIQKLCQKLGNLAWECCVVQDINFPSARMELTIIEIIID